MQSDNLDLELIAGGQENKHESANQSFYGLEAAITATYTAALASTADHTLPYESEEGGDKSGLQALRYVFSGTPGGAVNVIHPAKKHLCFVSNGTDQNIVFKTAAGSGATLNAGEDKLLYCDGTDVLQIGITGTIGSLNSITDVNVPAPVDGTILVYDSGAGEWVPFTGSDGQTFMWLNGAFVARQPYAISTEAGTTYAPVMDDINGIKDFTSATLVTVTLPLDATEAFPVGSRLSFLQGGAGQVEVEVEATGTLQHAAVFLPKTHSQYSLIHAIKKAADTWLLTGGLELA